MVLWISCFFRGFVGELWSDSFVRFGWVYFLGFIEVEWLV